MGTGMGTGTGADSGWVPIPIPVPILINEGDTPGAVTVLTPRGPGSLGQTRGPVKVWQANPSAGMASAGSYAVVDEIYNLLYCNTFDVDDVICLLILRPADFQVPLELPHRIRMVEQRSVTTV
jgi:hypothetical protein